MVCRGALDGVGALDRQGIPDGPSSPPERMRCVPPPVVQIILKKLEQSIAATAVPSSAGFTAPGAFLFELFGR